MQVAQVEHIVVNGRFQTMPVTGSQRYARELVGRLAGKLDAEILVAVPPDLLVAADQLETFKPPGRSWSGLRGHLWEQVTLPRVSAGGDLLISLANWGPLRVHRQVLAILDLAPLRLGGFFSWPYWTLTRVLQRQLARTVTRIVTLSQAMGLEIAATYDLDLNRIDVVPPGVGPPFTETQPRPPKRYCVFVGAHDPRKNLLFLLEFWPQLWGELGLELHVVARSASRPHRSAPTPETPGLRLHDDLDDRGLADLYAGALCLLSPSHYEGFGLPLLEAMATGTPFLATEAGAARELAVEASQILPLEAQAWVEALRSWSSADLGDLRRAVRRRAHAYGWDRSAALLAASVRRALVSCDE
ncbi:MAG: glycosyltransferase family 4 protein [Acidimicrobiia bacterium]